MSQYSPLHLHTFFSLMDGLNSPEEYVERAKELGITALSQTDHGTLAGHRDFQRACAAGGIKPILGLEAYISSTDRFDKRAPAKRTDGTSIYNHITLLSLNQNGFRNLSKMSEIAWTEGYYHKPRIDLEILEQYGDDMVVLSGCLNGLVAKNIENGNVAEAEAMALRLQGSFGDRFFIEVQSHNPAETNHELLRIADKFGISPAMASDCHYAKREDLWAEEAMLILSTSPKRAEEIDRSRLEKMSMLEKFNYLYPDRKMTFEKLELYLRSYEDERTAFESQGITRLDIYENTNLIADRVGEYDMYSGLDLLPSPKGNPHQILCQLVYDGLHRRGRTTEEYMDRAESELRQIIASNQSSYFLVVSEMVSWAKDNNILVGPGRGSSAGSLVNYALEITDIDPIKYDLLFTRFINVGSADYSIGA